MTETEVMDIVHEAILTAIYTAGPIMVVGLVIGVVISLLQALTQIQEMTLAFVPKILSIFAALLILMPYMLQMMTGFMHMITDKIVGLS